MKAEEYYNQQTDDEWEGVETFSKSFLISFAEDYADHRLQEAKKEIKRLKRENMTHEFNQAEAERFLPEYLRQIKEPLEEENKRLRAELNRGTGLVDDFLYSEDLDIREEASNWLKEASGLLNQLTEK